ncbi:hypothetical protein [Ruminococcus sp.]|uniref:hypothetical protein n=1 Tax=Ruminococcus sp. TaxID=41978 RepID=UPI0025FAD712|nr:hypothetical protein [Ruminococcus sp.]
MDWYKYFNGLFNDQFSEQLSEEIRKAIKVHGGQKSPYACSYYVKESKKEKPKKESIQPTKKQEKNTPDNTETTEGVPKEMNVKTNYESEWDNIVKSLLEASAKEYNPKYDEEGNEIEVNKPLITDYVLTATSGLSIPTKMDLFTGLDITEKDNLFIKIIDKHSLYRTVLFVNGENDAIGFFNIKTYNENGVSKNYLVTKADNIRFTDHKSTKFFFVFYEEIKSKKTFYKVPIEVEFHDTETTSTHLCIDFGTSNTTVGCFLDEHYVESISNLAIINGNVVLNSENVACFIDRERVNSKDQWDTITYHNIVPTVVYINDCSNPQEIDYAFGYEATRQIKDDNYCPNASCFMEIKRWTSNLDINENIQDSNGNKTTVCRRDIIAKYLLYVIRAAEDQFKCKFRNIHISAPVKLKSKVLDFYDEILAKYGYKLEKEHAIDEGIAVLYSIINNQIREDKYANGKSEKALIIDCGGGTSDLASCEFTIEKDEDGIINLDITTEYMNGDVNFGGNNLTYRIMQYMKIVYACMIQNKKRLNIDELINIDINALFSFIEGELENDDDGKVKDRYEEVYLAINDAYIKAEKVIPTRFSEYENQNKETFEKIKNNFYFLWKLADEMKKEFYRSTSISRYTFVMDSEKEKDIDLHVGRIENWRLSIVTDDGTLKEQPYPHITFTAKEIDKLLRADIYYLVRKFLNGLYMNKTLDTYSQIKLSGQSSKINIFMDSLKEFLPGKKIKSGRINSKGTDAEELKLLCLKGAIMYLHALEMSNIEVSLRNETQSIPISVYIKTQNGEDKEMIKQGSDWNQRANKGRITTAGKVVYLYMRNVDKEIGEPYKYSCEDIKYKQTRFEEISKLSYGLIGQDDIDNLPADKRYFFVFLNKEKWGFDIMPIYRDGNGKLYIGEEIEFCSFEMDILQESFFDGRK